jgi:hypothetical protein
MSKGWKAWEYRVLAENQTVEKTARLLKRDVGEVADKVNRHCQATFGGWYARRRLGCSTDTPPAYTGMPCLGSPESPKGMLRLARRMAEEDFEGVFADEEVECHALNVLDYCIRDFDPNQGDQSISVQARFVKRFRHWLKMRLTKEAERRGRPKAGSSTGVPVPKPATEDGAQKEYNLWARHLYQHALRRLDERTRAYVELRLGGSKVGDIAEALGVAPKTVSNHYGERKLVRLLRQEVEQMVLDLPVGHLQGVVAHLLHEVGLTADQVGHLLCVPPSALAGPLRAVQRGGGRPVLDLEGALGLLDAATPLARSA